MRKDDHHLTNAVLTTNTNSRTLTIYNQANDDPIEVQIPIVSDSVQNSAAALDRLKTSPIIDVIELSGRDQISRRMEFHSNLDSSTSMVTCYIPNKWSFIKSNNDGDWVYQTGEYEGGDHKGDFEESALPFHKDRSDVIEALNKPAAESENMSIKLGTKVVIGNICLMSTKLDNQGDDVLAVCDSTVPKLHSRMDS